MKQIIIFLLIFILAIIGYGQYSQYKRFHTEEEHYSSDKEIDINYHNQEVVYNYYHAIEDLNSFITLQWTANDIDVRAPENDDLETKSAVNTYAQKLAKVHFYENILAQSAQLKAKGLSNVEISFLEKEGMDVDRYEKKQTFEKIKRLYNPTINLYKGEKNAIIFEVQKRLVALGAEIQIDGVYRIETLNAIKKFEADNHLLADGYLDVLTIDYLFK